MVQLCLLTRAVDADEDFFPRLCEKSSQMSYIVVGCLAYALSKWLPTSIICVHRLSSLYETYTLHWATTKLIPISSNGENVHKDLTFINATWGPVMTTIKELRSRLLTT